MIVELTISDEEALALRERENAEEHHDVHFSVCPYCAKPTWINSNLAGTGRTVCLMNLTSPAICRSCDEFKHLHPAVSDWVMRVIRGQELIARRTKA